MKKVSPSDHIDWIKSITPDILWYYLDDIQDYQGDVVGVGVKDSKPLFFVAGYGSCSGCGEWGGWSEEDDVGAEPRDQEEVIKLTKSFNTVEEASQFLADYKEYLSKNRQDDYSVSHDEFWSLNTYQMSDDIIERFEDALVEIKKLTNNFYG